MIDSIAPCCTDCDFEQDNPKLSDTRGTSDCYFMRRLDARGCAISHFLFAAHCVQIIPPKANPLWPPNKYCRWFNLFYSTRNIRCDHRHPSWTHHDAPMCHPTHYDYHRRAQHRFRCDGVGSSRVPCELDWAAALVAAVVFILTSFKNL